MLLDDPGNSVYDPILRTYGCGATPAAYMSLSLADYWISSSHNTYLTGGQLKWFRVEGLGFSPSHNTYLAGDQLQDRR
jgi:hypothetical protein